MTRITALRLIPIFCLLLPAGPVRAGGPPETLAGLWARVESLGLSRGG